jgi:rhamnose utilization protein RhaD (predicted bifunctional aldolase and dehydrogenase)
VTIVSGNTAAADPALAQLARLSARLGRDIEMVQAAGGNTSLKLGDVLWIKASGTWLAEAEECAIFVPVALAETRAALAAGSEKIAVLGDAAGGLRPSIESSLHALMPHRVVLHLHAVNTLGWSVRRDAVPELERRLAGLAWAFLPYCRPGLPLSAALAGTIAERRPDVIVLGNHGLVVGAEDSPAAGRLASEVEARLALPVRTAPPPDRARLTALAEATPYRVPHHDDAHWAGTDAASARMAAGGSLYPDHVVFLGPGAPVMDAAATARRDSAVAPPFVLVRGVGALLRADLPRGAEEMLRCLGHVTARLPADAAPLYLAPEEEAALLNWDAEKYRRTLSSR